MTRPSFLADHDVNEHILAGMLRQEPEFQLLRLRDVGMSDADDANVLEFAYSTNLLVVSHDVNTMPAAAYSRLSAGKSFPGLLMIQQALPIAVAIEDLILIWAASEMEEWEDQVVFLPL